MIVFVHKCLNLQGTNSPTHCFPISWYREHTDMDLSEKFKKNAQQCLTLAHEAVNRERRAYWLEMGRLWSGLAQDAEEGISGNALLHDMAKMWIALANPLGERVGGPHPKTTN